MSKLGNCLTCGKDFKPNNKNQRFCSIFCFHEYPRLRERKTGLKFCNTCGKPKKINEFYPRRGSTHKGFRGSCKICEIKKISAYTKNNKDKVRASNHKRVKTPLGQYKKYKFSASRFKKDFKLDEKFFKENQNKPCFYCGSYITNALTMGVDRIDSKIGYVEENCVPCCSKCNLAKFTYSAEEFIQHAYDIVAYQERLKCLNQSKN